MSSDSIPFPPRPGLTRRSASHQQSPPAPPPPAAVRVDVDPPPKAKPVFQVLAFAFIVFFSALQFLPATHFRDPSDPLRGAWIPAADRLHASYEGLDPQDGSTQSAGNGGNIHIASWINCLDLRALVVLVNSTLTSSRYPDSIYFHFFLTETGNEKKSFYKLKVLFPDSNIEIIGQKEIREKIATGVPEIKSLWPILPELAPFIIPKIKPSLRRFAYIPPLAIMKGSIDDLFRTDMGPCPIAAAEDCNKRLHDHVNIDVVNAIQRTDAKDWVPKEPYDGSACVPELDVLLLAATRLEKNLLKSILWWNTVLGKEMKSDVVYPAVVLALSNRFLKLSPSWKFSGIEGSQMPNDSHVLHFDGPRTHCFESTKQQEIAGFGNNWRHHISMKSEIILSH